MSLNNKNSKLSICGLILCAGSGTRAGLPYNKLLYYVGKKTILEMTIDRFNQSRVNSLMLIVSPQDYEAVRNIVSNYSNVSIALGGATRSESVRKGLREISSCDIVVIHDGARPYVTGEVIDKSIESAINYGSGVVAVPTVDTIKEIQTEHIIKTLSRSGLYNIQTPQTFIFNQIAVAYDRITGDYADDSEVFERAGFTPRIVLGDYGNIKITHDLDLFFPHTEFMKVGIGFDVHKLVKGRQLVLGGIIIPHEKGLKGHSDADVLTHAVMDSLLSAAGLPDIGVMFPDTSAEFKNICSLELLAITRDLIYKRLYTISNISAVVMAEKPKIQPYIEAMRIKLAGVLQIDPRQINISATTTEELGIVGEEKGIAASSSCIMYY